MNYLAHAYLSFGYDDILIGNFIADTVKNKTNQYREEIRKGIRLHRLIDEFTDDNEHYKLSVKRIDKRFGLYAGVIVDMFYDHFLAANWKKFHHLSLQQFSVKVYSALLKEYQILPSRMKRMLPHMILTNWLVYYGNVNSFKLFFHGLSKRTSLGYEMIAAAAEIKKNYYELNNDFLLFMNDIIPYVKNLKNY